MAAADRANRTAAVSTPITIVLWFLAMACLLAGRLSGRQACRASTPPSRGVILLSRWPRLLGSGSIRALARSPGPRIGRRTVSKISPMPSLPTQRRDYLVGVLMVLASTVLFSLSGIFVRLLTAADPWRISFYRAGSMSIAVLAFLV